MKAKKYRHITLILAISIIVSVASSCGWHLRGSVALPDDLNTVFIDGAASTSELSTKLEILLRANKINVSDSIAETQLIINLENFEEKSRTATLGSNGRASEYELTTEVTYTVENSQGDTLAQATDASVIRSYQYDENNVVAAGGEQRLLQEEMRTELAQQILRRLRFIDFSTDQTTP